MTEFRILGPLAARRGDEELALGGRNQRAVLALLLLNANQVLSIERLAEELYGGETPVTAVTQVHRQVSELRKLLDPAAETAQSLIQTRPPGYVIQVAPGALDLERFERLTGQADVALRSDDAGTAASALREALALWRGPALADLAYEGFAQRPIARLAELRLSALEARIEAELSLGRHAQLVSELQELAAEHPTRERLRQLLMLALYRSGRQVEALEVYRATREELVQAFGVEPGPELQRLETAILRHDPALAGPQAQPPAPESRGGTVILTLRDPARLDALLSVAEPLARRPPRELIVALLAGDEAGLAAATETLARRRELLGPRTRAAAFISHTPSDDVLHLTRSHETDLLLLDATPELTGSAWPSAAVAEVLDRSPADVALMSGPAAGAGAGGVLVPFGGGEHDWAAVELGAWLAIASAQPLRLAGARAGHRGGRDASRLLADASLAVQRVVGIAATPLLVEPTAHGLVEAAAGATAVVVGLSPRWRREGLGEARRELAAAAGSPLLVVHRGPRPSGIGPARARHALHVVARGGLGH